MEDKSRHQVERILLNNDELRLDLVGFRRECSKLRLWIAELKAALRPFAVMHDLHEMERRAGVAAVIIEGESYRGQFWKNAKSTLSKGGCEDGPSTVLPGKEEGSS